MRTLTKTNKMKQQATETRFTRAIREERRFYRAFFWVLLLVLLALVSGMYATFYHVVEVSPSWYVVTLILLLFAMVISGMMINAYKQLINLKRFK